VIRTERYKLILNLAHQLPFPFASDLYESATWQSVKADPEQTLYGKRRITDFIHRPRYELYDLQKDPDEVINLAGDPNHAAVFQELAQKLKAFQKRTRDPWLVKYEYE
jgi:N-sulfoglucosamine sulfohydrolase